MRIDLVVRFLCRAYFCVALFAMLLTPSSSPLSAEQPQVWRSQHIVPARELDFKFDDAGRYFAYNRRSSPQIVVASMATGNIVNIFSVGATLNSYDIDRESHYLVASTRLFDEFGDEYGSAIRRFDIRRATEVSKLETEEHDIVGSVDGGKSFVYSQGKGNYSGPLLIDSIQRFTRAPGLIKISSDENLIAYTCYDSIRNSCRHRITIWNEPLQQHRWFYFPTPFMANLFAFTADSRYCVFGQDPLQVYSTADDEVRSIFTRAQISDFDVSRDNRLLIHTVPAASVILRDFATGNLVRRHQLDTSAQRVSFAPDAGSFLVLDNHKRLLLKSSSTGETLDTLTIRDERTDSIQAIQDYRFHPQDNSLIAYSEQGSFVAWQIDWPKLPGIPLDVNESGEKTAGFIIRPNPAMETTIVQVDLARRSELRISLRSVLGTLLRSERRGSMSAGRHSISVDLSGLPGGHYFLTLQHAQGSQTLPLQINK